MCSFRILCPYLQVFFHYNAHMFSIVIQAGGKSSRMGQDKALLPFLGEPLIVRVIRRVQSIADEILITTNYPENYRFLDVPLVSDPIPDRGALGGLYTALDAAQGEFVGIVACDMPFLNPNLLVYALGQAQQYSADAAIPGTEKGLEPIHAVYRKATCLPVVKKALDAGKWRMISWHNEAQILTLSPTVTSRFDPHGRTFMNLNTPEEFSEAEKWALKNAGLPDN